MVCAGKGSGSHKATMVEDTVGEPFQDTAGTPLHVLMKLLSPITLALAPLYLARQMIMETVSQVASETLLHGRLSLIGFQDIAESRSDM